jgi:hypothetical protein
VTRRWIIPVAAAIMVLAALTPVALGLVALGLVDSVHSGTVAPLAPSAEYEPPPPPPPPPPSPQVGLLTSGPEYDRVRAMLQILVNNVPAGYTTPETEVIEGLVEGRPTQIAVKQVQVIRTSDGRVSYHAGTDVYRGDQGGTLGVDVAVGPSTVTDDPCAAPGMSHQGADEGCHVLTASNGLKVRLSSTAGSRIYFAQVAYPDATVLVRQTLLGGLVQKAPLPGPFLSDRAFAELAAVPTLKP